MVYLSVNVVVSYMKKPKISRAKPNISKGENLPRIPDLL
jgi:hypothetical protein